MDANWDPDNATTWNAFFANRRDRQLKRNARELGL
jgi:hypothetical protein